MADLALPSFEIQGFRAFSDLRIERLGRVNLIVGKNNVGKSSLLEAIQIYASRGYPPLIWELLYARDESSFQPASLRKLSVPDLEDALTSLKYLFYGRPNLKQHPQAEIILGPVSDKRIRIKFSVDSVSSPDLAAVSVGQLQLFNSDMFDARALPQLTVQFDEQDSVRYSLMNTLSSRWFGAESKALPRSILVSVRGLTPSRIGELWDNISLTPSERNVLDALRIIAPGVEALTLVGDPVTARHRIPIVRIAGTDEPIPLRSLGDGMQRIFGLTLALVNAKDGVLLVDEIENGLHYQIQPQLWRVIFQAARQLNVQIFATSHSLDCIRAFQKVAREDEQSEGMLIRLEAKKNKITATLFDEHELEIATREQIEVR